MQEDKHAVKSCQSAVAKFSTVDHAPDIVKRPESDLHSAVKSIHHIDDQKIKDHKEAIDSILVFVSDILTL